MGWIFSLLLALGFAFAGYSRAKRAGLWSWSKFAFTLGFAALECVIVIAPIALGKLSSPYFWPVYIAAWIVAAANFVWFILVCRRWKLGDGRTSLEAERNSTAGK
jgi:hypothetical protein